VRTPRRPLPASVGHSGLEQGFDLFFDLIRLRKALQRLLGEDLPAIEKDLERSRFPGSDGDTPDFLGIVMEQVLRQTGGSGKISSGGAVFDPHQRFLLGCCFVRHVSSFAVRPSRERARGAAVEARCLSVA
jgi:hypothetical protein